jgi:hypothetical protein
MSIELPPTPATELEARSRANDLAYGFAKHVDDYFVANADGTPRYLGDPPYWWKRMLGWQAGGDDVARFGLYAVPPSPWHETATPPVVGDPPVVDPTSATLEARLTAIATQLVMLNRSFSALTDAIIGVHAPTYEGTVAIPSWLGTGKVVLTPKATP